MQCSRLVNRDRSHELGVTALNNSVYCKHSFHIIRVSHPYIPYLDRALMFMSSQVREKVILKKTPPNPQNNNKKITFYFKAFHYSKDFKTVHLALLSILL